MSNILLLATNEGLVIAEHDGDARTWRESARGLDDHDCTAVIAREGVILVGTTDGVYRSDDLGRTWRDASAGLMQRRVRWLAFHPDRSDFEFAGTEPAGIFVSHSGGAAWRDCPEIDPLRQTGRWYLPYSPEAGCVRGFAFHGSRAYAAVEVGGALVSDDAGETWHLAKGSTGKGTLTAPRLPNIASDVHSIEVHPSSAALVFAPTSNGLYRSEDGGEIWANLYQCYCRAVWVDPADPAHIIFGPADYVDRNGRLEETHDGGHTWKRLNVPAPAAWPEHMVERLTPIADHLLAVLSNGEVLAAPLATLSWDYILPGIPDVNAVTTMR